MKSRTSILLASASAFAAAIAFAGCTAGDPGTLGDPNAGEDTGGNPTDSGTGDTHVDAPTDNGVDNGVDSGVDSGKDTGVVDSGHDTLVDTADTSPIIPEGGVAAAPIAGGVIATNSKYKIIMQTSQGGSPNGPMTNSKYDLHGGTVTVVPK